MNKSKNGIEWLTEPAVRDLILRFPLAIALLDEAGNSLVLNDRFERTYGREALDFAPLQALTRNPVSGWHTMRVPSREQGEIEIKAQVVRVQGHPMLILDDATDPGLLRRLDRIA